MALKQRALMKLDMTKKHVLHVMRTKRKAAWGEVYRDLTEARELYREGLPRSGYAAYGEIYDGLILAIQKIMEGGEVNFQEEVLALCQELLEHLERETAKETRFKKEIFFLPYKVSMFDSLESVWRAADEDKEHCIAYVMPIPYADRNPDGTAARWHCERELFPKDVPTLDWQQTNLVEWHPDVIFIHTPYDNCNAVTSVDEQYYSRNLKYCANLLIYVPYYVTSGSMGDGQADCPAYQEVDYIVVQSESLRHFFASSVPKEKIVALGSPKFDKVIRFCGNPPEPPADWKNKMQGRKVYFYNTSLGGMLADTGAFLEKMKYVFRTFERRRDVCLLWRPHPLMDGTFDSLRKEYKPIFEQLKRYFIEHDLGIYDESPEIETAIAYSDAYIGDANTSVTALFGVAGKPMFLLDNHIHALPERDDWKGDIVRLESDMEFAEHWLVTRSNQLYHAENRPYQYRYCCDLCEYASGRYYRKVIEVQGKAYVCPVGAQDIVVVAKGKIERKIPFKRRTEKIGAFATAWQYQRYIFLVPLFYPAIVRYDTETDEILYLEGANQLFAKYIDAEWRIGGSCIWQGKLLIASPNTAQVLVVDCDTLECEVRTIGEESGHGCFVLAPDGADIWILPYDGGFEVKRWNPKTNECRTYANIPRDFYSVHPIYDFPCALRPYSTPAFDNHYVYFAPHWGNKFLRLHKESGIFEEWVPQIPASLNPKNGYFFIQWKGDFLKKSGEKRYQFFHAAERKLYEVELSTGECREMPIEFSMQELREHAPGFHELSEGIRYGCEETAFHTLQDFLDGEIDDTFSEDAQKKAFGKIAANGDGSSGRAIYQFAMEERKERPG